MLLQPRDHLNWFNNTLKYATFYDNALQLIAPTMAATGTEVELYMYHTAVLHIYTIVIFCTPAFIESNSSFTIRNAVGRIVNEAKIIM